MLFPQRKPGSGTIEMELKFLSFKSFCETRERKNHKNWIMIFTELQSYRSAQSPANCDIYEANKSSSRGSRLELNATVSDRNLHSTKNGGHLD